MSRASSIRRTNQSTLDSVIWEVRECQRAIAARLDKLQTKRAEQGPGPGPGYSPEFSTQEVEETILDMDLAMLALSLCTLKLEKRKRELRASFPRPEDQDMEPISADLRKAESQPTRTQQRLTWGGQQGNWRRQYGDSDSSSEWSMVKPAPRQSQRVRSLVVTQRETEFLKLWEECSKGDRMQGQSPPTKTQIEMDFDRFCGLGSEEVKTREEETHSSSPMRTTTSLRQTTSQTFPPSVGATTTTAVPSASAPPGNQKSSRPLRNDDGEDRTTTDDWHLAGESYRSRSRSLMTFTDMDEDPVAANRARALGRYGFSEKDLTRRASAPLLQRPEKKAQEGKKSLRDSKGEGGDGSFWAKVVGNIRKMFTKNSGSSTAGGTRNIVVQEL